MLLMAGGLGLIPGQGTGSHMPQPKPGTTVCVCVCMCVCVCLCVCVCVCVHHSLSHVFATPGFVTCQASLSVKFFRQEYWNGLSFPPPGDLPDPGIELVSPVSPALWVDSLPASHQGSLYITHTCIEGLFIIKKKKERENGYWVGCWQCLPLHCEFKMIIAAFTICTSEALLIAVHMLIHGKYYHPKISVERAETDRG